jgi:hypothetical protein
MDASVGASTFIASQRIVPGQKKPRKRTQKTKQNRQRPTQREKKEKKPKKYVMSHLNSNRFREGYPCEHIVVQHGDELME